MAIPWDSIRSLALFFGPMLIPKAVSYYRSARAASRQHGLPVRPVPRRVRPALALLLLVAGLCLVRALPPLAPENVFARTQSRLQIPVDVLFHRVAALRSPSSSGGGGLGPRDEALRAKFVNLESRLLYLQLGPGVLADCPFCNVDDPQSYLYYALPDVLWPHLGNLAVVAAVTSPGWTASAGAQWRALAAIAAGLLAALDVYLLSSYDHQANARALRLGDVDFFFWSLRLYRLAALAALDGLLAWLLYLSSTGRAFARPPGPAERVDAVARSLLAAKSKMSAMGIVKNTALRDEDLRSRSQAYWMHEVRLMGEVMEERDVVEGVNDALSSRIDMQTILRDAEAYSQAVLQPLQDQAPDGAS